MPKFTLERRVPSCLVTKDLLSAIETYLKIDMCQKMGGLGNGINYQIDIKEKIGTETLRSIGDYAPTMFLDGTKEVEIRWKNGQQADCRLNIAINFNSETYYLSKLTVECDAPTSRETATGIGDAILRLLDSHRTHNWIFNPFPIPIIIPFFSCATLFLLLHGASTMPQNQQRGLYFLYGAAVVGWIVFSAYFRPYISFDTRQQRMIDKVWLYFSLGAFGFVFFGTLLPLLRKALVGF